MKSFILYNIINPANTRIIREFEYRGLLLINVEIQTVIIKLTINMGDNNFIIYFVLFNS